MHPGKFWKVMEFKLGYGNSWKSHRIQYQSWKVMESPGKLWEVVEKSGNLKDYELYVFIQLFISLNKNFEII